MTRGLVPPRSTAATLRGLGAVGGISLLGAACAEPEPEAPEPEVLSDYRLVLSPQSLDNQDPFDAGADVSLVLTAPDGDRQVLLAGSADADRTLQALPTWPSGTRVGILVEAAGGTPDAWDPDRTLAYGEIVLDGELGVDGATFERDVLVTRVGEAGLLDTPDTNDERLFAGAAMVPGGDVYLFGGTDVGRLIDTRPAATRMVYKLAGTDDGARTFAKIDTNLPESLFVGITSDTTDDARAGLSATWVDDDGVARILVAGGRRDIDQVDGNTASALLFDPATEDWVMDDGEPLVLDLPTGRSEHVALRLVNSDVLMLGGIHDDGVLLAEATLYEADRRSFRTIDLTPTGLGLYRPLGTSLGLDGAMICGGADLSAGDQTDPWPARATCVRLTLDGTVIPLADMPVPLVDMAMVQLADGRVLMTGGMPDALTADRSAPPLASRDAFIYDLAADTWTAAGTLRTGRSGHQMIALPDGGALVVGGVAGSGALFNNTLEPVVCPERYDATNGTFTQQTACGGAGAGYGPVVAEAPGDGAFVLEGWSLDAA